MRGHRLRQVLATSGATIIGLALALAAAAPASAHTQLVGSDPREGATLAAAPAFIRLTFSESLVEGGVAVVAADSRGRTVTLDAPRVDGPVVEVLWPDTAVGDTFTVTYRVVSTDAHPITGVLSFSVAGDPTPSPSPSPTATSATPTPSPTSSPSPSTSTPTPAPTPDPAPAAPVLSWVLGLLAVVVIAGLVVGSVLIARRRR